ncbi:uncharacterized protein [Cherax quadricarinatus]
MRRAILLLVGLAVVGAIPTLPTTSEPDIQQLILSAKAEDNNIDGEGKVQPDEEVESSLQDLASSALPDQDQVSTVGEEQVSKAEQPQAEAESGPEAEKTSETQPQVEQTEPKVEQVNDDPEPQIEQINVDSEPQVEPQPDVGLFPLEPFEGNPLLKGDSGFVTVGHDTKFELPMVDKAEQEMGGFTEDYVGVDSPIVRGTLEEMAQDIFRLFVPSFNSNDSPSAGEVVTEDLPQEYIHPNTELVQPADETYSYEFSPEMSANVEEQDERGEYFPNTPAGDNEEVPSDLIPVEGDTLPVDEDVIVMVEEENPIDETKAPLAPNNDYPLVTEFSYEPIFREEVSLANFFIPSFERETHEEPTADETPFGMMPGDFSPEEMAPHIEETVPLTEELAHEETLPAEELNLPEEPIAVFPQNINEGDFYTPDNLASDLSAGVPEMQPFMPGEENYKSESTDAQFASNPLPVPTLLDQVMQGRPGEEEFAESTFQNSVIPDLVIESNSGPIADMREQIKMEDGDSSDTDNGVEIIVMSNPQQNSEDDMIPVIATNGEQIITEERPLPIAEFPAEKYATPIAVNQQQRWTLHDNILPISSPNDDEIPQMFKIFHPQWRENLNFLPSIEQQIQPQFDQHQLPIMEEPQEVNMYTIAHNMPPEFPTQPEGLQDDQIMHIRDNMPFQFPPQSKSLQQESDMYILGNTMPLFPTQSKLHQQTPKINIIRENMSPLLSTLPELPEQTPNMYMKRENMFSQFPIQPEIPQRAPYLMNSRFPPISFRSGDDTFEPNQGRFNEDFDIYQAPDNFQRNYGQASAFQNILKNFDTFKPQPFSYKMFPQEDYPRSVSYGKSISRSMQPRMSEPNFNTLERTFMPQNRLMQQNFYPEASARLQRFVQDPFENYELSYIDNEPEESETSYKIRPSNMPMTFDKFNLPQSQYDIEIYPIEMPYTPNYNPFALSSYRNSRLQYPRYQFPSSPNFRTKYLTSYDEPDYFDSDIYSYDY